MDNTQFKQLNDRLHIITKLLPAGVVSSKTLTEQVDYLTSVGMTPSQIASTLGKPLNSITGIVSYLKKKEGKS